MRKLAVTVCLAVLAAVAAPSAFAYRGGPSSPITLPANKPAVKALLQDLEGTDTYTPGAQTGVDRARMASGRLAPLRVVGNIALVASGSLTVWKIADALGVGGFVYRKITGESLGYTPTFGPVSFMWNSGSVAGLTMPAPGRWYLRQGGSPSSDYPVPYSNWNAGNGYLAWQPWAVEAHAISGTETAVPHDCDAGAGGCVIKLRTETEMLRRVVIAPSTAAEFASPPAGAATVTAGTNDTTAISDAELADALDALGATDSTNRSSTDPDIEAAVDEINHDLDPSYDADTFSMPDCVGLTYSACGGLLAAAGHTGTVSATTLTLGTADLDYGPNVVTIQPYAPGATLSPGVAIILTRNPSVMPLLMPQPLANETYAAYVTRLQDLGLLGEITFTQLSPEASEPQLGPDAPVRIRARVATATGEVDSVLSPLHWPSSSPRIDPNADVQIDRNSPEMAPQEGEMPAPGAGDAGGYSCDCPPIDLSPLTETHASDKFPFGVFAWFGAAMGIFDTEPVAPSFNWLLHHYDLGGPTSEIDANASVDLGDVGGDNPEIFSDYMAIVRTLMSFALWIGAIWFVATRMLGFHAAGDVSEAADDGMPFQ